MISPGEGETITCYSRSIPGYCQPIPSHELTPITGTRVPFSPVDSPKKSSAVSLINQMSIAEHQSVMQGGDPETAPDREILDTSFFDTPEVRDYLGSLG